MSAPRALAFLALMAGVSAGLGMDCSYFGLLDHLNLSGASNALAGVRPVKNWTIPTTVWIDLMIFGITEVHEKSQTFTCHTWIKMGWTNEFLSWNPFDFCGINRVAVRREMLWSPDIIILEDISDGGTSKKGPYVSLLPSGVVVAREVQRLTTTCQLDIVKFPFDFQICNISFSSMIDDGKGKSIVVEPFTNSSILSKISETYMITQGEWELKNITSITYNNKMDNISQLVYQVTIVRRPKLYLMNFILPLFFFLILDVASFFISEARGEKLSFKVTILLSISVLLLILKDILPSTEKGLPMIALYCIVIFILVGLSVLEAMLVSFLVDLDGCKGAPNSATCTETQVQAAHQKEPDGDAEQPGEERPTDPVLLERILEEVKAVRREWLSTNGVERDRKKPGPYIRVARCIDSVFFVVYVITIVAFLVYMWHDWILDYYLFPTE